MISKKLKKSKKSNDFNFSLVRNCFQLIKFQLKKGIKKAPLQGLCGGGLWVVRILFLQYSVLNYNL